MSIEHSVTLPGGVLINGKLHCDVTFKILTGYIEQNIEDLRRSANAAMYVTEVLTLSLKKIGGVKPDCELINSLSIVDRQFLMLQLSIFIDGSELWLHPLCGNCSEKYDIYINRIELPVIKAKESYPRATAIINNKEVRLKVPIGKDQIKLYQSQNNEMVSGLLKSCVETVANEIPQNIFFDSLTKSDIETIESALDSISPAVCTQISTVCPECGNKEEIQLNPYSLSQKNNEELMADIHCLASHYHWNEDEILSLPRERRQKYMKFINSDNGVYA